MESKLHVAATFVTAKLVYNTYCDSNSLLFATVQAHAE